MVRAGGLQANMPAVAAMAVAARRRDTIQADRTSWRCASSADTRIARVWALGRRRARSVLFIVVSLVASDLGSLVFRPDLIGGAKAHTANRVRPALAFVSA